MHTPRRSPRPGPIGPISPDVALSISRPAAALDLVLRGAGHTDQGWRRPDLVPVTLAADGRLSARIVWRHRDQRASVVLAIRFNWDDLAAAEASHA